MKILIINKSDSFGGTATLACSERDLLRENHGVQTILAAALHHQKETTPLRNGLQAFVEKAVDFVDRKRGIMYEHLSFSGKNLLALIKKEKPDFVHLHNLHGGYLSLDILPQIAALTTLVWNINDMWPLTAHCSVTNGCEKWKTGCKECPHLGNYPSLGIDKTEDIFAKKLKIYQQTNFIPVVPSHYMQKMVSESPLFAGKTPVHISLGVDSSIFTPDFTHKKPDSLLFVAERPSNRDKGFEIAKKAVIKAAETLQKKLIFTTVTREPISIDHPLVDHRPFSYISSKELAKRYQESELLVSPTAGETFGFTLIESAACGTPFLAPDNTAIPEHTKRLGLTPVAERSVEAFATRIVEHLSKNGKNT
ncbi:glycosyltransferase, partial [bacterium]|nr:glycosyltransferase [bacterium]